LDNFTGDPGGDPGGSIAPAPVPEADGDLGAWEAAEEAGLGDAGGEVVVVEAAEVVVVVVRAAASPASGGPVSERPSFGVGKSASAPASNTICMYMYIAHVHAYVVDASKHY